MHNSFFVSGKIKLICNFCTRYGESGICLYDQIAKSDIVVWILVIP